MISFIVPAHNEQAFLGRTLQAIHAAASSAGQPYEVIVVDDASTDATAELARRHNAAVVTVSYRQIAATRNAGGRAASGDRLFFVDADTIVTPRAVAAALRAMDRGAVGGGAPARFDRTAPLYGHLLLWWLGLLMRLAGLCGGAFLFCTREAFLATGGFDERLFAAEDAAMSWALRREGRFVVLWHYVVTSSRRLRGMRGPRALLGLLRIGFWPQTLRQRAGVRKIWYESEREAEDRRPRWAAALAGRLLNAVMLFLVLGWIFPWPLIPPGLTPRESVLGQLRVGFGIMNCHIALVCWPCAYWLLRELFRQPRWWERVRLAALLGLCLWFAWGATPVVLWSWTSLYHGLVH